MCNVFAPVSSMVGLWFLTKVTGGMQDVKGSDFLIYEI
jgi:hypothetical protein